MFSVGMEIMCVGVWMCVCVCSGICNAAKKKKIRQLYENQEMDLLQAIVHEYMSYNFLFSLQCIVYIFAHFKMQLLSFEQIFVSICFNVSTFHTNFMSFSFKMLQLHCIFNKYSECTQWNSAFF